MSLLLAGLIVAGAGGAMAMGRWFARRRADGGPDDANADASAKKSVPPPKNAETPAKKAETTPKKVDKPPLLDEFPCQLGDVVMRPTGEEAWLAGALVLSEEVPVAVLFIAPDAGADCAIYVRPRPRESLYWLAPLDPASVLVGGEPPSSVEHEGTRFERRRRLPLRPRRLGTGAPDVGENLLIAEYESPGAERLLVLKSSKGARAFRGIELESGMYDVIPSGRSTLDD